MGVGFDVKIGDDECESRIGVELTSSTLTGFKGGPIQISQEAATKLDKIMTENFQKNGKMNVSEAVEIIRETVPGFDKTVNDVEPGKKCMF